MKTITLEKIYKKIIELQREVSQIKKNLLKEPDLRQGFILRMKDIDTQKSILVDDFTKRYGLRQCINSLLKRVLIKSSKNSNKRIKNCFDSLIEKFRISC